METPHLLVMIHQDDVQPVSSSAGTSHITVSPFFALLLLLLLSVQRLHVSSVEKLATFLQVEYRLWVKVLNVGQGTDLCVSYTDI